MSSMSISGLSTGTTGTNAVRGMHRPPPPSGGGGGGHSPMDAVKDMLKLSTDEITSALQQGKSLNDLATQQGVSHQALIAALKAGAPDDLSRSSDADQMLEAVAAQTGVQGTGSVRGTGGVDATSGVSSTSGVSGAEGHRGHHRHGSAAQVGQLDGSVSGVLSGSLTVGQQSTLDQLSSLLGTASTSLINALRDGTSLADLLNGSSVDTGTLAGIVQDGLLVDTKS
jgi:hypothetical protein